MRKEENLHWLNVEITTWENECQSKHPIKEALHAARKALEQEPTLEKDGTLIVTTEHYENVGRVLVQCGTDGTLFYQDQELFINKPCVSEKQCEHDKNVVLDKIRAEIDSINLNEIVLKYENSLYGFQQGVFYGFQQEVLKILDKHKAESEGEE